MLLEKAFASWLGYGDLEGRTSLWALHVMTGDKVIKWHKDPKDVWKPLEMRIDDEKGRDGFRCILFP